MCGGSFEEKQPTKQTNKQNPQNQKGQWEVGVPRGCTRSCTGWVEHFRSCFALSQHTWQVLVNKQAGTQLGTAQPRSPRCKNRSKASCRGRKGGNSLGDRGNPARCDGGGARVEARMGVREHPQVRGRGSSSLDRSNKPRVTKLGQVRRWGLGAQARALPSVLCSCLRAEAVAPPAPDSYSGPAPPRLAPPRPARGLFRRRAFGGEAHPFKSRAPEVVTRRRRGRK